MTFHWPASCSVSLILVSIAPFALAQDYMGAFTDAGQIMSDIATNAAVGKSIADAVGDSPKRDRHAEIERANLAHASAKLDFSRDPDVSERVQRGVLALVAERDESVAARFEAEMRRDGFSAGLNAKLASQGLSIDNLADVAAYLLAVNWSAVHRSAMPDAGAVQAVRDQISASMANEVDARHLDDTQKQIVADDMLLRAYMLSRTLEQARKRNDAATQRALSVGARQHIRETMSIDLGQYVLANAGLEPLQR